MAFLTGAVRLGANILHIFQVLVINLIHHLVQPQQVCADESCDFALFLHPFDYLGTLDLLLYWTRFDRLALKLFDSVLLLAKRQ